MAGRPPDRRGPPRTDLALLEISAERSLAGAPLGNSAKVRVGEWVVAIGSPFGLEETVTVGILSAKGRTLEGSEFSGFLQTDATIHRGNSGGPLLNLRGEVIGVNTAVVTGAPGIGFAIPINLVRRLLPELRQFGRVRRGWIGVAVQDVDPELARYFRLSGAGGVLVTHVQEKGTGPRRPACGRGTSSCRWTGATSKARRISNVRWNAPPINIPTDLRLLRGGKAPEGAGDRPRTAGASAGLHQPDPTRPACASAPGAAPSIAHPFRRQPNGDR